jgi:hypothetical protein
MMHGNSTDFTCGREFIKLKISVASTCGRKVIFFSHCNTLKIIMADEASFDATHLVNNAPSVKEPLAMAE